MYTCTLHLYAPLTYYYYGAYTTLHVHECTPYPAESVQ